MMRELAIFLVTAIVGAVIGAALAHWHYSPRLTAAAARLDAATTLQREQQRAIEALRAQSEERRRAAEEAQARAREARDEADRYAADLLTRLPPSGVDECRAVVDLIREELRR